MSLHTKKLALAFAGGVSLAMVCGSANATVFNVFDSTNTPQLVLPTVEVTDGGTVSGNNVVHVEVSVGPESSNLGLLTALWLELDPGITLADIFFQGAFKPGPTEPSLVQNFENQDNTDGNPSYTGTEPIGTGSLNSLNLSGLGLGDYLDDGVFDLGFNFNPDGSATNDHIFDLGNSKGGLDVTTLTGATLVFDIVLDGLEKSFADLSFIGLRFQRVCPADDGTFPLGCDPGVTEGSDKLIGSYNPNAPIDTVPVPAALPLIASAFGALGFLGWRRKKASKSA